MINLKKIEKQAIKILKKGRVRSDGSPKDIKHTLRVRDKALEITDLVEKPVNRRVIAASALLHDIGWSFIDFKDKAWAIGAHAGAGSYRAFQIVLNNGATLDQAFLIQEIIQIHDFDVAWEGHKEEIKIVKKFLKSINTETYCLIAADKGDRFSNIEAYLDLFNPNDTELIKNKLQRLLNLSDLWFKNKQIESLYKKGINKIEEKLNSIS